MFIHSRHAKESAHARGVAREWVFMVGTYVGWIPICRDFLYSGKYRQGLLCVYVAGNVSNRAIFCLGRVKLEQGRSSNSQLSTAISAPVPPKEPQDHDQPIHRDPLNELIKDF